MQRILFSLFLFIAILPAKAQNFHGQWKGYFIDKSASSLSFGSERSDYVLDLDVQDSMVTGYSYTYFSDGGHKYYTICRLSGTVDKTKKRVQVMETERTKTNVPDNISNSFQVHTLTWRKDGDSEILEGTWRPAPGQGINTGYGATYLAKRQLTEISPLAKKINALKDPGNKSPGNSVALSGKTKPGAPAKISPTAPPVNAPAKPTTAARKIPAAPVAKAKTPVITKRVPAPPVTTTAVTNPPVKKDPPVTAKTGLLKPIAASAVKDSMQKMQVTAVIKPIAEKLNFEQRDSKLLQTVLVENSSVKVELYDNGEVDGDSVSLFYNGNVLLAHKMLSEKAITIDIPVNNDAINELVMYADNLGTIPPNTALMIVYDGTKRYEVRITSDLKQSGTIRFIHSGSSAKQ